MDKIFIGSGVAKFNGDLVECSVCITDAESHIFEYNGKRYLKIKVQKKRQPDNYGKTHSVEVNTWKPEKTQRPAQNAQPSQSTQPAQEKSDDLPF